MSKSAFTQANDNRPTKPEEDNLPQWDFSKFYPELPSAEYDADIEKMEGMVRAFAEKYEGKVGDLSGDELAALLDEDQKIDALAGKVGTFVALKNTQDSVKYNKEARRFSDKMGEMSQLTAFLSAEISDIDDDRFEAMLKHSESLQKWEPALRSLRKTRPHQFPSLDVTKYAFATSASGSGAWVKYYEDHHSQKRYRFEGQDVPEGVVLKAMSGDPDKGRRYRAYQSVIKGLKADEELSVRIYDNIIQSKRVNDEFRNFENPWDSRHLSNEVEPEMVDALEQAVKSSYEDIPHRFYALKAKLMGQSELKVYDRNVLPKSIGAEEKYIPFEDAKKIVLEAYGSFAQPMAQIAERFFDEGRIDAAQGENKAGGAFAHPGAAYLVHPMVMLNYLGDARDVSTMAHELGHGIHQDLAAHKGDAIKHTPLTLAETASVFGEMITFKSLLAKADGDDQRRALLWEKVNDMVGVVHRQVAFYDFEKRVHMARRDGPLDAETISRHWLESQQESYGDAVPLGEDYGCMWSYIPHIHVTPFYVYAYAFGDCLVNALYSVYEEGSVENFEEKYINMLEAGGTYTFDDLKEDFGLDARDPQFWKKGLNVVENMLNELEELCEPLLDKKAAPSVEKAPAPWA